MRVRVVRAAREVGRVAVAEQVRIRAVAALTVAAAQANAVIEVVVALQIQLVTRADVHSLIEPVGRVGERRARLVW